MDDWNLALDVGFGEAVVVDAADVEIAAVSAAGQIKLRDAFRQSGLQDAVGRLIISQAVILEERRIGRQHAIPTPGPSIAESELAGRFDRAAEIAVARRGRAAVAQERVLVELI